MRISDWSSDVCSSDLAERKFRLAEQQRDEKLKKIQAERAKAEREARLAEQKLKQIADLRAKQASEDAAASAPPPPGNEGVDTGLRARYAAAIQAAVLSNWKIGRASCRERECQYV